MGQSNPLTRLLDARKRRRKHSRFDSPLKAAVRRMERSVKFLLSNPLGALLRPRRATVPLSPADVSSILILRYDLLGDVVLSTPVWRSIKRLAPHIKIGVAASARNRSLVAADVDVDEVFVFSKAITLSLIRELFRARRSKWDIVINPFFHDKTRGAIFAKIVSPQGISATSVRGNNEKYERIYSVVGDRPPLHPPTPMVQQNLLLLKEVLDLPIQIDSERPSLPPFADIAHAFLKQLREILERSGTDDYIIINTDASQSFREWGLENSLALARKITSAHPRRHVFLSSAPERADPLRQMLALETNISYLETPSILHLAVAVRGAVAVVSPDTSVVHFATAAEVPVVGLYLEENEFLPYSSASRVLIPSDGKTASLIPMEDVYKALIEIARPGG